MSDLVATFVPQVGESVSVQEEATVSRTILKAEGTRVVMFSFDTGQQLTEHTAAMPVIIQVMSGAMTLEAGGEAHQMRPGDILHMTTRTPHAVTALEPTVMMLTMIDARVKP